MGLDKGFDSGVKKEMPFFYGVEHRNARQSLGSAQCRIGLPSGESVAEIEIACVKRHPLRFVDRDSVG